MGRLGRGLAGLLGVVLLACGKDGPPVTPVVPASNKMWVGKVEPVYLEGNSNAPAFHIVRWTGEHSYLKGNYNSAWMNFIERDVMTLYLDFSDNAGIVIEISEELLGKEVALEKGAEHWFFSYIGGDMTRFKALRNTTLDFKGYTGWFRVAVDKGSDVCALQFEISLDGYVVAKGDIEKMLNRKAGFES